MNALASFAPILVLSVGGLGYLLGTKIIDRLRIGALLAVLLIALAGFVTVGLTESAPLVRYGLLITPFSKLLALVACGGALVSLLATASSLQREAITTTSEYYYLMITSLCGALVMIFASDFLTLFIGVEVASLALYCLCGARVTSPRSSEASMKYFLLGCFSSACLLYGVAVWYGATGSLVISRPGAALLDAPIMAVSFLMILIGIAFKIGLAPFHFWVPDVYQGAPTSVTTFMSCVVKVAAVAALIRVSSSAFGYQELWSTGSVWMLSVVAMTVGNLAALQQASVKRLLAYSSVAQAGYMMIGIAVAGETPGAIAATVYYLIAYCAMTIGAFAVLSVIGPDADDLKDLKGLSKRSRFLAVTMTLFFLGLAGLPPSLAGLMGKVYLFSEALSAKFYGLAIVAALNSALACAYYFRVPVAIFFQSGDSNEPVSVSSSAYLGIALCAIAVVLFGVFPEPFLVASRAAAHSLSVR
jgi:NADH-quinone oxidoreductase subunit N